MSATIHQFPQLSIKAEAARRVAAHLIVSAEAIKPDTEAVLGGLMQATFEVATNSTQPHIGRKTVNSLRQLADLIEMIDKAKSVH